MELNSKAERTLLRSMEISNCFLLKAFAESGHGLIEIGLLRKANLLTERMRKKNSF